MVIITNELDMVVIFISDDIFLITWQNSYNSYIFTIYKVREYLYFKRVFTDFLF